MLKMGHAALKTDYSREEYLAVEEYADYKNEFYNGEIFAMSGGSRNHSVICVNLNWKLAEFLDDKDCTVFDSNMKLEISKENLFVYPDLMAVCGEIGFSGNRTDIITNPVLIIEVLSPATHAFDRSKKFEFYRTVPSLREYVLISQEQAMVEVFYRQDSKIWLYTVAKGIGESVLLRSINYELALKDIYRKVIIT
jgi:Uma2 family endonuclease